MKTYWGSIKDKKKLYEGVKEYKNYCENQMATVVNQAGIYQSYYESRHAEYYQGRPVNDAISHNARRAFAYNIIGTIIDGALNKISRVKPKPSFLSNSFVYSMRKKIKKLDVMVLNNLKKEQIFFKADRVTKNALVQNIGILKSFPHKKDKVEYYPIEIYNFYTANPYEGDIDNRIAGDRVPLTLYHIYKYVYPEMKPEEKKEFITQYQLEDIEQRLMEGTFTDRQVDVFDFFDVKNKKRVTFTDKCLLTLEKWEYDFLPYDFMYWQAPQFGLIGVGISEILTPMQIRCNVLLQKISTSLDISFFPIIVAPNGSRVIRRFSDEAGQVITYEGARPPTQFTQSVTHPQNFQHFLHIIDMMYKMVRMDETALATSVPEGVNKASGIAIENLETADSSKLYNPIKYLEDFIISISKKTAKYIVNENIDNIKDTIKDDKKFFENINTWAVSLFPSTPDGKFKKAEFLVQAGLMAPDEVADLYDFPELAGDAVAMKGAKIAAIYSKLEKAVYEKKQAVVDPVLGLDNQLEIAEGIYSKLMLEEKKYEKEIMLIRKFIGECSDLLQANEDAVFQRDLQRQAMIGQIQQNTDQTKAPPPSPLAAPS